MHLSQKKKQDRTPISRKTAVSILVATLVPTLFVLVLLIAFRLIWAIPFLLLLVIVAAGITNRKRPDFFAALKKKKKAEEEIHLDLPTEFKPSSSRRSYMMLVSISHAASQQITINSSPFIIGRDANSDFCISDDYVSHRHLIIDYDVEENTCFATDVSLKGSYLNSVRRDTNVRCQLHQGDTLQIAGLLFRVEYVHF